MQQTRPRSTKFLVHDELAGKSKFSTIAAHIPPVADNLSGERRRQSFDNTRETIFTAKTLCSTLDHWLAKGHPCFTGYSRTRDNDSDDGLTYNGEPMTSDSYSGE